MKGTGVFATPEEIKQANRLAAHYQTAAFLASRRGPLAADIAGEEMWKGVHAMALAHGLPEIEGYYGMAGDGEFVTASEPEGT